MDETIKKFSQIDRLVGQEVSPEMLRSLVTEGRVKFPFKPTSTSAVSQAGDQQDPNEESKNDLDDLLNSVIENEDLVKTLEDMRDDMLAGMKIPPVNDAVSDAAKLLGSNDGTIDKNVFDNAQTILDPNIFIPNQLGVSPVIGALTGNGQIGGDFLDCNEVTKGIAENWQVLSPDEVTAQTASDVQAKNAGKSIRDAKQSFAKKLAQMFAQIFAMLWWEMIWPRVVIFFIETTEKLIARPIDAIFLIIRWKRFNYLNFLKYGPIHKLLNKLKILLLCKVPKKAWKHYNPDPKLKVFYKRKLRSLADICSNYDNDDEPKECGEKQSQPTDIHEDGIVDAERDGFPSGDKNKDHQETLRASTEKAFPKGPASCLPTRLFDLFPEEELEGPGFGPQCAEAAKLILDAVMDDAMHYSEYNQLDAIIGTQNSTQGNIKDSLQEAQNAN